MDGLLRMPRRQAPGPFGSDGQNPFQLQRWADQDELGESARFGLTRPRSRTAWPSTMAPCSLRVAPRGHRLLGKGGMPSWAVVPLTP